MNKLRKLSSSISDLFRASTSHLNDREEPASAAERFPLHNAAVFGNSVETEFLLHSHRCVANDEDDKGRIPLHYSVQRPETYISELLIRFGANVDAVDYTEATPSHFAAKEGMLENTMLLLARGADFCSRDKIGKTAVDVAAEEGHTELVRVLLQEGCVRSLLKQLLHSHRISNTPLHLAARNGHVEIVNLLLNTVGFPINIMTAQGTALHEAVKHGRLQVVRLLIHRGINVKLRDQHGLTALAVAEQTRERIPVSMPLITELLLDASNRTYGVAVRDFLPSCSDQSGRRFREGGNCGPRGSELPLKAGDIVWILGAKQTDKVYWRGITFSARGNSLCGYFPRRVVKLQRRLRDFDAMGYEICRKSSSGGRQRKVKKVNVPVVPDVMGDLGESVFNSSSTTDYHTDSGSSASDRNSCYTNSSAPLPGLSPTPSRSGSLFDTATVASLTDDDYSCTETVAITSNPMSRSCSNAMQHANSYGSIAYSYSNGSSDSHSNSPFRTRPSLMPTQASSSSIASQYSNRSSSSCMIDNPSSRASGALSASTSRSTNVLYSAAPVATTPAPHRMAQVMRGSQRQQRHRVADMVAKGIPETEIITEWLGGLRLPQYLQLFLAQGYDLASIARMTPQDLVALGVSQPEHRRLMVQDIHEWNITDGYPSYVPGSNGIRDFLTAIGLAHYVELFESQNYTTIKVLEELQWEDLEELGVKKLGHMKRLCIALKKLKTNREARQRAACQAEASAPPPPPHETHFNAPSPSFGYPTGTLTSRSSSAIGDPTSAFNTLRQPSRMSMPAMPPELPRRRPVAPVFPSHHMPSPLLDASLHLSGKDSADAAKRDTSESISQNGIQFADEPVRKPTKLNLITRDQILSKLDDIENDSVLSASFADDIPPSPAPISSKSVLDHIYGFRLPAHASGLDAKDMSDFELFKDEPYRVINGSSGLPADVHDRYSPENYFMGEMDDLTHMLKDLTDELEAQLQPCGSTAV